MLLRGRLGVKTRAHIILGFQALGSRITRAPFPLFHDGCWGATLESQPSLRCVSACLPSSSYGARNLRIVDKKRVGSNCLD